ncbi:putative membrane protein [Streptomyces lividans 1326]|uniref:Putative membrane protein n=1 Tax=Streptomyces lividans 1326 TaxID=1200984 RepID=A0A7U9HBE1_STRLI|nr:putative membrane protein [Streptomyces lividans 1326]
MPPLADSGRRTLARIIDMILVGIVVWLLSWAFNVQEYTVDGDEVSVGKSFGQSVIAAVLYIAYDTYMTTRTGQTLGKKWLGMRVANLDNGATPSVQTSLIRALVLWIPLRVLLRLRVDDHRGRLELLRQALQTGPARQGGQDGRGQHALTDPDAQAARPRVASARHPRRPGPPRAPAPVPGPRRCGGAARRSPRASWAGGPSWRPAARGRGPRRR